MTIDVTKFQKLANSAIDGRVAISNSDVFVEAPKSFKGKIVRYIRDKLGLNKADNRKVMQMFIDTIKDHYGHDASLVRDTTRELHLDLSRGKPLSVRQVRESLETADAYDTEDFDYVDNFSVRP